MIVLRLEPLWLLLLTVGLYGAALQWRGGALLAIAAVCAKISGHLVVGWSEYQRIMRQPWPKVAPLTGDEDDW